MEDIKTCRWCGETYPLKEGFYKHPMMRDGHLNKCKECQKQNSTEARMRDLDGKRAYDRERAKLPHRKASMVRTTKLLREKEPLMAGAQRAVAREIKAGRLIRCPCSRCGRTTNVHAHHDDYSKPLDVTWLCPPCHAVRHAEQKQERAEG